jgi:hypothetical protein
MKRTLAVLALAGTLALGACSSPVSTSSIVSDAQALLTAAEASGAISPKNAALVAGVITGFETVASATKSPIADGDSSIKTALSSLGAAIGQVAADSPDATIQGDATLAQTALAKLASDTAGVTQTAVERAVATFLIDYLAAESTASAAPRTASPVAKLIIDAREKIAALN